MRTAILICLSMAMGVFLAYGDSASPEGPSQIRVIVNESNSMDSMSKRQVSNLLLKRSTRWADGRDVDPVDQDLDSPTRQAFSQTIHGRGAQAIDSYWQRQIFSGRSVPPPMLSSDEEVIAFVRDRAGGVGYVSRSARLEGVRELTVVGP